MKKFLYSRTVRIFSLCYICFFLVVGSVVTSNYIRETKQEREAYTLTIENESNNIINHFSQSFEACVNTCNSIFLSRWYTHYRNVANIYSNEFNGMEKIEIQTDILAKVNALTFVSNILVITPSRDNVICKNGWFTFHEYNMIYGTVSIDLPDDQTKPPVVTAADDSICVITLQDTTSRRDRGVICILIDKKSFANTLERIVSEQAKYVKVELGSETLYERGALDDGLVLNTSSINMPQLSILLGSLSYEDTLMKTRQTNYILVLIIALLVDAGVSAMITAIVHKPLSQIVKRFGGNFSQLNNPYDFISDYVETFCEQNEQLSREKEKLSKSMDRFLSLMRNEILFGMLTNPKFNFLDEYICETIPWINDGNPYIMALLEPKFQDDAEPPDSSVFEASIDHIVHFCKFSILYSGQCILLWFNDLSTVKQQRPTVEEKIESIYGSKYFFSVSNVLQNPKSMHESYLTLKNEISNQFAQLDFPLSLQIELVTKLQTNKKEECITLLNQAKLAYSPSSVIRLLARIALEYNVDSAKIRNKYAKCQKDQSEQWNILLDFADQICKAINSVKCVGMNESSDVIKRYIEENYCDPYLSVKELSDRFCMHRTLISKILKAQLGITFSDYLLELRIKKSMDLLKNTDMNINAVAESVGYVNYLTFKRAFIRYRGISPKEFRSR